jgi:hypothetical protein
MGYTTEFSGQLEMNRRLTETEIDILDTFMGATHDNAELGVKHMRYCNWKLEEFNGGDVLLINESSWGGDEAITLQTLIEKFFKPWGIVLNGTITATGSASDDHWRIDVDDNEVSTHDEEVADSDTLERLNKLTETPARTVVRYFEIYKQYLTDNNLDDDTNSISVEDLIDFVESQIDEEDRAEYMKHTTV